jgi:hypothetical protein
MHACIYNACVQPAELSTRGTCRRHMHACMHAHTSDVHMKIEHATESNRAQMKPASAAITHALERVSSSSSYGLAKSSHLSDLTAGPHIGCAALRAAWNEKMECVFTLASMLCAWVV